MIDLSTLNLYIWPQPFKMETTKTVRQSILVNDQTVSIDLTDAYLHVPVHPQSRTVSFSAIRSSDLRALPFGMSLSAWVFTKLMDVIVAYLRQRAILLFPYLDDWLIRDLVRGRLKSHTIYCLQTMQSLGFIPNLKRHIWTQLSNSSLSVWNSWHNTIQSENH